MALLLTDTQTIHLVKMVCCSECDGIGSKDYVDDYDSIVDAKEDWPNAVSFTYI